MKHGAGLHLALLCGAERRCGNAWRRRNRGVRPALFIFPLAGRRSVATLRVTLRRRARTHWHASPRCTTIAALLAAGCAVAAAQWAFC